MGVDYVFMSAYLSSNDLFHRELHDGSYLSRPVVMEDAFVEREVVGGAWRGSVEEGG